MAFKNLKEAFELEIIKPIREGGPVEDHVWKYWELRLLFEIAGNLDSLVVSNRNTEKHIGKMSAAYVELVKLTKERNGQQKPQ